MGDDWAALKVQAEKSLVESWLREHLSRQGYEPCPPRALDSRRGLGRNLPGRGRGVPDPGPRTLAPGRYRRALHEREFCLRNRALARRGAGGSVRQRSVSLVSLQEPGRGGPPARALAEAFAQQNLGKISLLLGWPGQTLRVGYTQDWDGMPVHWREIVSPPHDQFTELWFQRPDGGLLSQDLNWRDEPG